MGGSTSTHKGQVYIEANLGRSLLAILLFEGLGQRSVLFPRAFETFGFIAHVFA